MNTFKLLNITKEDLLSNKFSFDANILNEKFGQEYSEQNCTVISIIGEASSGKSYVFKNILQFLNPNNKNPNQENKYEESDVYSAIGGVLIKNNESQNKEGSILLLDCSFNSDIVHKKNRLQEQICSFILKISQITIYTSTDVTFDEVNSQNLIVNSKYSLDTKKICLLINRQTINDIKQLMEVDDNKDFDNKFHRIFYLLQKNKNKKNKQCEYFSKIKDYINDQLKIKQQQHTLKEIIQSIQEKINIFQQQQSEENQLDHQYSKSDCAQYKNSECQFIFKMNEQYHNIQQLGKFIQVPNTNIQYFNIIEFINIIKGENIQKKFQNLSIQLLEDQYKDKKCVVTSFLGLKNSGKSTIAHQFINLIDPSIKIEQLQEVSKNKPKGNCFVIEKNEIIHLIIDSEELFGKCQDQNNLIEETISKLETQSIIEQVSDFSYFVKNQIRLNKSEVDSIQEFKQLQKFIFGQIKKSGFIFNKLNEYEYEELLKNDCKIKIINDNYDNLQYVRVNSELCDEVSSNSDIEQGNEKNGFKDDIQTIITIQDDKVNQTCKDFVNQIQECLEKRQKNIIVSSLNSSLFQYLKQHISAIKDESINLINKQIVEFQVYSDASQDLLDYLRNQIISQQVDQFNTKFENIIEQFHQQQKLRQNLMRIYVSQFSNKRLLEDLIKSDSQDLDEIKSLGYFDQHNIKNLQSNKMEEEKKNFQNIFKNFITSFKQKFFYLFQIKNYTKNKEIENFIFTSLDIYQKFQSQQDQRLMNKEDIGLIIKKIIPISKKVLELKKDNKCKEYYIEKIIKQISNLNNLGKLLFEQTKKFDIQESQEEQIIQTLEKKAMDQNKFEQILNQEKKDPKFAIKIPNININKEDNILEAQEKLWYTLLSYQIIDNTFILEKIYLPLLIQILEKLSVRLSDHYLKNQLANFETNQQNNYKQ